MKPFTEKNQQACMLRTSGYSLREISEQLHVAKSTVSLWVRGIELGDEARGRIKSVHQLGRDKYIEYVKQRRKTKEALYATLAMNTLSNISLNVDMEKMFCALLYWAEGNKGKVTSVRFTNSNPLMIKTYLTMFRHAFHVNEHKFRALVHLHDYHDEEEILHYWSEVTLFPIAQFLRSYIKPHTGIQKHKGYMGCICIYYYDMKIAHELSMLYNTFAQQVIEGAWRNW